MEGNISEIGVVVGAAVGISALVLALWVSVTSMKQRQKQAGIALGTATLLVMFVLACYGVLKWVQDMDPITTWGMLGICIFLGIIAVWAHMDMRKQRHKQEAERLNKLKRKWLHQLKQEGRQRFKRHKQELRERLYY